METITTIMISVDGEQKIGFEGTLKPVPVPSEPAPAPVTDSTT
jgi:hypothetical protein